VLRAVCGQCILVCAECMWCVLTVAASKTAPIIVLCECCMIAYIGLEGVGVDGWIDVILLHHVLSSFTVRSNPFIPVPPTH
jgi:hypothetical protein